MDQKKWTVKENRERLISGAQVMVDGLTNIYPDLAPFETPLVKAMFDLCRIVGAHAASYGDDPDLMPEPQLAQEVDVPLEFSLYGAFDIPLVC